MAKRIVHQLIDDIDGTVLADGEGETLTFGLDGRSYEIDLGDENAAALREMFARYTAAGRRQGTSSPGPRPRRSNGSSHSGNVRDWAQAQGISVPSRGRVPNEVLDAYRAAHA